jgi:hypothetical protein
MIPHVSVELILVHAGLKYPMTSTNRLFAFVARYVSESRVDVDDYTVRIGDRYSFPCVCKDIRSKALACGGRRLFNRQRGQSCLIGKPLRLDRGWLAWKPMKDAKRTQELPLADTIGCAQQDRRFARMAMSEKGAQERCVAMSYAITASDEADTPMYWCCLLAKLSNVSTKNSGKFGGSCHERK